MSDDDKEIERLSRENGLLLEALNAACNVLHDVETQYDHDTDAHRYGTPCRECEAGKVIRLIKGILPPEVIAKLPTPAMR